MRLIRVAVACVLGGGVLLLPGAAAAIAKPHYVGIVIGSRYACVRWHAGVTGDDVLNAAARVTYRSDGIVLTIDGNPDPAYADDTHFWSYWHDTGGHWHYSTVGASGYQPTAGTVEGWSYDDGQADAPQPAADPAGLYAGICGARDKPTPKPTPTPSHTHHVIASTPPATPATATRASVPAPRTAEHAPATTATPATTRSARPTRAGTKRTRRPAPPTGESSPAAVTSAAGAGTSHSALRPPTPSLRPLPESTAAAASDSGSPVGLLIGIGAAVLIGAGGVWTALRRRRAS
jgi:hypothetical protein